VASVTALEPDPRGSGGVRVQVDGSPYALVDAADVAALGLAVGAGLDAAALARVERRGEAFAARAAALRILAYRALPSPEIVRRLVRKGHARAVAEEVVGALVASGLIDDAEVARHYARTRARRYRYGPARLVRDLRRLGIGEAEARAAVASALEQDGVDVGALLRAAARRKLDTLRDLEPPVRRRRLKTYLLRRGFAASDVIEVVKEAVAG
jgi:regulatory protein